MKNPFKPATPVEEAQHNLDVAVAGKQALLADPNTTAKQLAEANALIELCEARLVTAQREKREQDDADTVAEEKRLAELQHAALVTTARATNTKLKSLPKLATECEAAALPFVKTAAALLRTAGEVREVPPSEWQIRNRAWPTPLNDIRVDFSGDPLANLLGQVLARAAHEAGVALPGIAFDSTAPKASALMRQISTLGGWFHDIIVNRMLPAPPPPRVVEPPAPWHPRRANLSPTDPQYRNRENWWRGQDGLAYQKERLIEQFGWTFDALGEAITWPDVRQKQSNLRHVVAPDMPVSGRAANNLPAVLEQQHEGAATTPFPEAPPPALRPYTGPPIDAMAEMREAGKRLLSPEQLIAAARAELVARAAQDGAGATMPADTPATGSEGSGSPAAPAPTSETDSMEDVL